MIEKSLISSLTQADPQVFGMMEGELARQRDGLELIASETFVSLAVLQAQGSVLTNKYAKDILTRNTMAAANMSKTSKSWP